jgi:hypothetical protein
MANYLTFASSEPFTIGVNNATKNWDGTLYYSTDTATWNEWDGITTITSAAHGGEQKIYMRGSGNSVITGAADSTCRWEIIGNNIRCIGNIENLLDHKIVVNGEHPAMGSHCYAYLFYACRNLITAPLLPAPELSEHCYQTMFNTTGITTAPALPATTLAAYCYSSMFGCCESLNTLPALPATAFLDSCYQSMFVDCPLIKLSETQTDEYPYEYRIPISGTGIIADGKTFNLGMFTRTGGTYTGVYGTISYDTTYYTANEVIPADIPVTPTPALDPLPMLMGWRTGNAVRTMRK